MKKSIKPIQQRRHVRDMGMRSQIRTTQKDKIAICDPIGRMQKKAHCNALGCLIERRKNPNGQ